MKVVLLAGGFGSRISEESIFRPKPMIEIGGMPILWHIMKEYAAYGLSIAVASPKYKRWFLYWCGLMFVAAIAWNWFKLAGRGLA